MSERLFPIMGGPAIPWRLIAPYDPKPPKLTRGQARYEEWLRVSDVYNVTFGEWLKMQHRATLAQKESV